MGDFGRRCPLLWLWEKYWSSSQTLTAGIAAFDRKKFLGLGGYDELNLVGPCEDVGLCYRGWKRAWSAYDVPASGKYHLGWLSCEKAFAEKITQAMVVRNSILFMVKNISAPLFCPRCLVFLPLRMTFGILTSRFYFVAGFIGALRWLSEALYARSSAIKQSVVGDRDLWRRFNEGLWMRDELTPKYLRRHCVERVESGRSLPEFSALGRWNLRHR